MRSVAIVTSLLAPTAVCAQAYPGLESVEAFAGAEIAADTELADARGAFLLPNGLEIALVVRMDAAVDGRLVLRSVFSIDQGPSTLAVYAPAPGQQGPRAAMTVTAQSGASTGVEVEFNRQTPVVLGPAERSVPTSIGVWMGTGGERIDVAPDGLSPLPATVGGPAVATAAGNVTLTQVSNGTQIRLIGSDLDIRQLAGAAFANIVANTASNRTIDTVTTVNIDIGNYDPALVGASSRLVDGIALDAVRTRGN